MLHNEPTYYPIVEFLFTRKFLSIIRGTTTGTNGASEKGMEGLSIRQFKLHLFMSNIHQQMREIIMMYRVVMWTKIMTSFWNISTASAPIHITATRHSHTASKGFSSVDPGYKYQQHANESTVQLDVVL